MLGPLTIRPGLDIPAGELRWRFSRSSGPGGQSVNTADSRVELSFDVANTSSLGDRLRERAVQRLGERLVGGVITVTASEHRSQLRNREAAAARLAQLLREAIAPPPAATSRDQADPRVRTPAARRQAAAFCGKAAEDPPVRHQSGSRIR